MEDRVIGTLMGQAVGDALGTTYEFSSADEATIAVKRNKVSGHLPIVGGGPFQLVPGQITDDTELALMIARRLPGVSDVGVMYVAKAFIDWQWSAPFDEGAATRTAFSQIDPKRPVEEIHKAMMYNATHNMNSLSNGCLMKISPVAIIGVLATVRNVDYSNEDIADLAGNICKLTNPNPIAVDACRVYVLAVRDAARGIERNIIWSKAVTNANTKLVGQILYDARLRASPAIAQDRDPIPVDGKGQGYLGVALQLAFYELLYSKSFEEALVRTVSRGGDTDTNGCIVGALLGAYYGYSAIPSDWSRAVLEVKNPRVKVLPEVATNDLLSLALRLGYKQ